MVDSLVIVTSFYLPDDAIRLPEAIETALAAHFRSNIISELHVLTEADEQLIQRLISEICGCKTLEVVKTRLRPTFAELFEHASNRIAEIGGMAAILNSDISFGCDDDIRRCFASLAEFPSSSQSPIYALTRHDAVQSEWEITLFEECGLPNMLSTDCWLIASPVQLRAADSYSLGQMNCDLMANFDLISAGYSIFNPCLDVCIKHHELHLKTNEFYVEASGTSDTLEQLSSFMTSRGNPSYQYYGVPRVASGWLTSGYRPLPYSNKTKKLFVRVRASETPGFLIRLLKIEDFAIKHSFDLILLVEDSLNDLFGKCIPMIASNVRIYFMKLGCPFDSFVNSLLVYGYDRHQCIAFASSMRLLSEQLSTTSDFIILDLEKPSGGRHEIRRNRINETSADVTVGSYSSIDNYLYSHGSVGDECRCTLITSLFKSDHFLEKFLSNIKSLANYDVQIDHIFMVSETSADERRVLTRHLSESQNALIVWNRTDPGLYACWNIGIGLAQTDYLSNANVDDLRAPDHVSKLVKILKDMPHVGVVCSSIIPFERHTGELVEGRTSDIWYSDQGGEFRFNDLGKVVQEDDSIFRLKPHNLPHCMPVWRKALHGNYGLFDEERYGTFADWAFWLKVTKDGVAGYLHPEPLSYYYINPNSHNRRGDKLEGFHRQIESEFLDTFVALEGSVNPKRRPTRLAASVVNMIPAAERKLNLTMSNLFYGKHRNSFSSLVESLRPLHLGAGGVLFLPFIERYFVWGDRDGEARSKNPRPIENEWIGILHVPFDSPAWFAKGQRPEMFFETELWNQSFPSCRGIICLSKDLKFDLNSYYPDLPTLALKHPTELNARRFDFDAYERNPRLVQIGDWLRHLQAIYRVNASGHKKMMLTKQSTKGHLDEETGEFGSFVNKSVLVKEFVSNKAYDEILSSSVVLCFLYASAANNLVLECIVRNTPIIINPLPSVVEYLGDQYPLYATSVEMADCLLMDRKRILEASEYLRHRAAIIDLSYRGFQETFAASDFYGGL